MQKDFINWHEFKEKLHKRNKKIFFKEREIWWCSLGINIGYEQDGKNNFFERPILVLKKFNQDIFWALPLTSKIKNKNLNYYQLKFTKNNDSVILSQLRLISGNRLLRRINTLNNNDFYNIKKAIINILIKNDPAFSGEVSELLKIN